MLANADACAAVDAKLFLDDSVTVSDANGFGGTPLDTIGTTLAFCDV
jgi:hypothetical protein